MNDPIEQDLRTPLAAQVASRCRDKFARSMSLAVLRRHGLVLCLGAATAVYLAWILLWQYTQFVNGRFSYHDLTLISDFFTNAIQHGRPFWITDFGVTHFKTHLTPTLLLLVPAFLFFKSQFALIAIVACTVALGLFLAAREQFDGLERAGVPLLYRSLLTASFFLLLALNRYTLRCLGSAHFEPVYILAAVSVLIAVRRGASSKVLLLTCLLALGVRQDTGLFLFFLLLSCLLAPESWTAMHRPRVAAAVVGCSIYVVFATKVALPWFGSDTATRMWQRWGETWPDVFVSWTMQPELVYKALGESEFFAYNAQFYFLQVIHGMAWLLNQLPSVLFYTADAWDKQRLAYYNASFLLPGMLLSLAFGQLVAVAFVDRLTRMAPWTWARHLALGLLTAAFVYASIATAFLSDRENEHVLEIGNLDRHDVFASQPLRRLLHCRHVKAVAADFKSIVFVPLSFDKYLLHHALKADVVVVRRGSKEIRHLPYYVAPKVVRAQLAQARYQRALDVDGYEVFVAPGLRCFTDGEAGG